MCSAFLSLLLWHSIFCSYFIFRVKDYISSGLQNKIIDPDGGIHCSKKQFENGNYHGNKVVEWPREDWTLSLDKAPEFQHCFIFSYLSGKRNSEEKRRGAFKSKREGYAMFKASHVFDVKFNTSHDDFCFFDLRVKVSANPKLTVLHNVGFLYDSINLRNRFRLKKNP